MTADLLRRKSTGVTDARRELIRMLAAIAVEQYLAEINKAVRADDVQAREDQDERHPPKR